MGKLDNPTGSILGGRTTSATPGTPTVLGGSTNCAWVVVSAETDNTGIVAVGGSNAVRATAGSQTSGVLLSAGRSVSLPVDNLSDLWIDASVGGDGVSYIYGVNT